MQTDRAYRLLGVDLEALLLRDVVEKTLYQPSASRAVQMTSR